MCKSNGLNAAQAVLSKRRMAWPASCRMEAWFRVVALSRESCSASLARNKSFCRPDLVADVTHAFTE